MVTEIPLSLEDVSTDWLTRALRESGLIGRDRVVGMDARLVGQGAGFMGNVAMLGLTLSSASNKPLSLVLKIPTDTENRHVGQTIGVYEREIRFYQELQPQLTIRTPRHVYSAMDVTSDPGKTLKALRALDRMPIWLIRAMLPMLNWMSSRSTYRYVLLIESLEGLRIGDQVGGCTVEEAQSVLDTMARMHARFWNGADLQQFPWLLSLDVGLKPLQMMFLQALEPFKKAHRHWLSSRQVAILDWLKAHYFDLIAALRATPDTLIHGDFRLDNLCFDDAKGEVILFDWQTLARGACGFDLAYFLSASFAEPDPPIDALIAYYRDRLAENGVSLSHAQLRWQYEAGLLAVIHRVVPAQFQDMLDLGEGRGVDLIDSWLERGFLAVERIDPQRILEGPPR